MRSAVVTFSVALASACGPPAPPVTPDAGQWFDEALAPCRIGGAAPQTVDDVIARINLLPMPMTVPCFTASLPRPLPVVTTTSRFSAQPAGGPEDPRVFLFLGGVIASVVTSGDGSTLLELGELVTSSRTLKAELKFPVTRPVTRDDAYAHLDYVPASTTCGLCHSGEERHPAHALARVSLALRPPARTVMPLSRARALSEACDPTAQRERCLAFASVFGFGEVVEGVFPSSFGDFIK
ncbi:MAG: hypothetical protein JNJ54_21180 [Myxococcaceae bacterium]|nr:hypothetical protein [Myxococcaceae bacterium]